MSVGGTIEETASATADTFKSLSLSLPIETTKYTFICLFLSRVLNVKDEVKITESTSQKTLLEKSDQKDIASAPHKPPKKKRPVEILPGICIPNDIWLKEDVTIKDVKIKISLLQEINTMLESELQSASSYDKPIQIDLTTLSYYEKLLTAYKFLQMPSRESFASNYKKNNVDLTLKEEEGEDELDDNDLFDDNKSLVRTSSRTSVSTAFFTNSNNSSSSTTSGTRNQMPSPTSTIANGSTNGNSAASKSITSPNPNTNQFQNSLTSTPTNSGNAPTTKRISALSRELMSSRKRFSTLLGHNNNTQANSNNNNGTVSPYASGSIVSPPPNEYPGASNYYSSVHGSNASILNGELSPGNTTYVEEDSKKQQALNSLLAKSKLYHKIKKHRESSSSLNSSTSGYSSFSYSNRNSISTTNTTNSSQSRRRASSTVTTPDFTERSLLQPVRIPMVQFPTLSSAQKHENQNIKLQYYVQLKRLSIVTGSILESINKSVQSHNLVRLVDFVKNYVFKFIIVDVSQMIIDYGYFQAMGFCKS